MGWFYNHITLKGMTQQAVVAALDELNRVADVSPTVSGITVVYGSSYMNELGPKLSAHLGCPALVVQIFDSDDMYYWLCDAGVVIDEYVSSLPIDAAYDETAEDPETLVWPPSVGGNAAMLCSVFGASAAVADVAEILDHRNRSSKGDTSACWSPQERHERLVIALQLPAFSADLIHWGIDRVAALHFTAILADACDLSGYAMTRAARSQPSHLPLRAFWQVERREGKYVIHHRKGNGAME